MRLLQLILIFCFLFTLHAHAQQSFVPNAGTTGTTLNKLAKRNGSGQAIITDTSDTSGAIGIVASGAGTSGEVLLVSRGPATCVFDGSTTRDHFVQISPTVAGNCVDTGAVWPTSGQVIGRSMSTNVGAGTYSVFVIAAWDPEELRSANAGLPSELDLGPHIVMGASPLILEGLTADDFEATIAVVDPTADRIFTIPNAASVAAQPLTCTGNDKFSGISAAGLLTCGADQNSGGSPAFSTVTPGTNTGALVIGTSGSLSISGSGTISATDLACSGCVASAEVAADVATQAEIDLKAALASPTFTGTPAAPTASVDTNTTQLATTAYVVGQGYAKLASPTLTGTPAAPTPAVADDTTKLATTAFVQREVRSAIGTADLAIANTETVVAQIVFPADELVAGATYMIRAYATRAGTTSAASVSRIRVGTTALTGNIAATLTSAASTLAVGTVIEGLVTIRSAGSGGTVLGSLGLETHLAAVTITKSISPSTATVAVNTTTANMIIALTFISGHANNTFTFRNAAMWRVN